MRDPKLLRAGKYLSNLDLWFYDTWLSRTSRDLWWRYLEKPARDLIKMYQWYRNVFKNDYDFDSHSLFSIIHYKLVRLKPVLENGISLQEPEHMKALRIAIKLSARLNNDDYDLRAWDRHGKRWGELKSWTEPCEDKDGYSRYFSSRPNAVTEEQKELERVERILGSQRAYDIMKRDERWLYAVLHKYLRNWWS